MCLEFYPTPEIFNTDQGSQFLSDIWVRSMEDKGITQSKDGKGRRAIDNVFIERFWRSYKYEYLYPNYPNGGKELFDETQIYIDFYSFERGHQSLNKKISAEAYFQRRVHFDQPKYSASLV